VLCAKKLSVFLAVLFASNVFAQESTNLPTGFDIGDKPIPTEKFSASCETAQGMNVSYDFSANAMKRGITTNSDIGILVLYSEGCG